MLTCGDFAQRVQPPDAADISVTLYSSSIFSLLKYKARLRKNRGRDEKCDDTYERQRA